MREILSLKSPAEAHAILAGFPPVGTEEVDLDAADGRVLAHDFVCPQDTPPFPRAVMDGYALRAADTAGAGEAAPVRLALRGAVPMGGEHAGTVGPGDAVAITTGGVLPTGADAVVMVEYTRQPAPDAVEVLIAASPGDHLVRPGDDLRAGEVALAAGRRLRPQDVGLLASFGVMRPVVFRRPRFGLLSTGDEIVPPDAEPPRGKIRDVNQTVLAAQVRRAGAVPVPGGIVPDAEPALRAAVAGLLARADAVLLSGGSSVGAHDIAARVVGGLGAPGILLHGINVRPGKPTLIARIGDQAVIGMPGHPVSSMIIFDVFLRPFIARLAGEAPRDPWPARRRAVMSQGFTSAVGREEYVRVRLHAPVRLGEPWRAEPLHGGSAIYGHIVRADGLVQIAAPTAGLEQGEDVEVLLYG